MSPLERLQLDVTHYLLSHGQLQYVTITHVRPRTAGEAAGIETKLARMLAGLEPRNGKMGVAVLVGMPVVEGVNAEVRALRGDMVLPIEIMENILINGGAEGTGASCETHALTVAALLQQQVFHPFNPLISEPRLMVPAPEALLDKTIKYRITMRVPLVCDRVDKVVEPTVQQSGGSITLACATSGAALYYTLDGSFPGPGNKAALLYSTLLSLAPGVHELRAAAYLAGLAGSHSIAAEITVS